MEIEYNMRQYERETEFRAAYPSYRGPWPLRPPSNDMRILDAYFSMEHKQPYIDGSPRTPVPMQEPDPMPDATGQPASLPRTGRPAAYWGIYAACE
jgi:hypothetical protein